MVNEFFIPEKIKKFFECFGYKNIQFSNNFVLTYEDAENGGKDLYFYVSSPPYTDYTPLYFRPNYMRKAKSESEVTERFLKSLIGNYGEKCFLHDRYDTSKSAPFPKDEIDLEILLSMYEK